MIATDRCQATWPKHRAALLDQAGRMQVVGTEAGGAAPHGSRNPPDHAPGCRSRGSKASEGVSCYDRLCQTRRPMSLFVTRYWSEKL